jgi:hypothetical protein
MNLPIRIVGVYNLPENEDVSLIEAIIDAPPSKVDMGKFTQENPSLPQSSWQVAYLEHYLNENGDALACDLYDLPEDDLPPTRAAFFLYFVELKKPLITPFGEVTLPVKQRIPERLINIIHFEDVD